jgi:hypothetical protein
MAQPVPERALLTGGTVIVQAKLGGQSLRIHAGGSRRFNLLDHEGDPILCALGNLSLIPRTEAAAETELPSGAEAP